MAKATTKPYIWQIYWNLRRKCYSVKHVPSGLVYYHLSKFYCYQPEFRVSLAGRRRVRDTRQKNVHAYIMTNVLYVSAIQHHRWMGQKFLPPLSSSVRPLNEGPKEPTPDQPMYNLTYDPYDDVVGFHDRKGIEVIKKCAALFAHVDVSSGKPRSYIIGTPMANAGAGK